jgi:SAM-dependent methyltransferase
VRGGTRARGCFALRPPMPLRIVPRVPTTRSRPLLALVLATACTASAQAPTPKLDVPYEPTSPEVVEAMLDLAGVKAGDVVYDLGCGDGRIVVAAAKRGARGVGVDIDPQRIREAHENARAAGVEDRVELRVEDLFQTDVRPATVVMLFLWPKVNLRLKPRLLDQLRPGARVVSHSHDMGAWMPDRTILVGRARVHLWTIPERGNR